MRTIKFTPGGFVPGNTYTAELVYNGNVVDSISNLVENTQRSFTVTTAGNYTLRVRSQQDGACIFTQNIQAFFPVVNYTEGDVDCNNNTYSFIINLTNASTAGSGVQYGWSLQNDCSTVTNWGSNGNFNVPADDVIRYFFVKNNIPTCCSIIVGSTKSPCITCDLTVTNISFTCG